MTEVEGPDPTSPRQGFADAFNQLYAAAGRPPYARVERDCQRLLTIAGPRGGAVAVAPRRQRISDWRTGVSVPERFDGLHAVLRVLIPMARQTAAVPSVPGLYELERWHGWWEAARTSPAGVGSTGKGEAEQNGRIPAGGAGAVNGAVTGAVRPGAGAAAVGAPYRGLEPFRAGDAPYFFGREKAAAMVVETTRVAAADGRGLAMVVAASGAGKSSLLRAGLQASVEAGTAQIWPGSTAGCAVVVLTPGADPVAALVEALPGLGEVLGDLDRPGDPDADPDPAAAADRPCDGAIEENADGGAAAPGLELGAGDPAEPDGGCFPQRVRAAVAAEASRRAGPGARLVVIVDQLEELFTLCEDPARRERFVRLVAAASGGVGAPAVVVAGLRADLYHRCLSYPPLARALQRDQMVLAAMTATELRAAVVGPARAVGLRVEAPLLDVVLAEAGLAPRSGGRRAAALEAGLLPLVSHALRATWERRQGGRLTVAGYRAAGGIHGAVSTTAERAIAGVPRPQQEAALRLLVSLTRVDEETRDTRRRRAREALLAGSADPDAARRALEVLVGERLVSVDTDMVEIAHDALLTAWPRLREHLNRYRAGLRLAQQLDEAAAAWEAQQCAPDLLYRGTQLEASEASVGGADGQLSGRARRFLAASAHQRQRQQRAGRARRRRGRAAVAAIAVLAVAALAFGALAVGSASRADQQRDDARLAEVLATADRIRPQDASVAAQLYLAAGRMRPGDPQVQGRILSTQQWPLARPLPGSAGAIYDAAYSPDGRTLATATENHTVALWNLTDPAHPHLWSAGLVAGPGWISAAVFSPDGRTLAATGQDGLVRLWDVTDPARPIPLGTPLDAHAGSASMLAFSPDGHTVATANDDHTVRLWDVSDPVHATPEAVLTGHTGIVRTVAFSPDGQLLATGADDKTTLLWNVHNPVRPVRVGPTLTGHDAAVHSVAFSPNSRLLATGSDDSSARLWDVTDPTAAHPIGKALQVHRGSIWSVSFSPDGQRLAVGSQDGSASLWSVITPAAPTPIGDRLVTTTGGILAVTFSPDGRTLVTGGSDGTTLLWSPPSRTLLGPTDRVFTVAFSPDGQTLAAGSHDHSVWLWTVHDAGHPVALGPPLTGDRGVVTALAFSPDGRVLATGSGEGSTIRLWDTHDPAHPAPLGAPLPARTQYASPVAFSPDGHTLVTAATDESLRLWDTHDPAHPIALGPALTGATGYLNAVAFDRTGQTLAAASSDGRLWLWDTHDPAHPSLLTSLSPGAGELLAAAFSPDGRTLAAAGNDGVVRLWDLTNPHDPTPAGTLTGPAAPVHALAFDRTGQQLTAGSGDAQAWVWTLAPAGTAPATPTDPGGPGPGAPWALAGHSGTIRAVAFSPTSTLLATGSEDDTVRLWDFSLPDAATRICTATGASLSDPAAWRRALPDLPYAPPC